MLTTHLPSVSLIISASQESSAVNFIKEMSKAVEHFGLETYSTFLTKTTFNTQCLTQYGIINTEKEEIYQNEEKINTAPHIHDMHKTFKSNYIVLYFLFHSSKIK